MKAQYEDILALTDKKPDWYDSDGVPRFAQFHPDLCPNIYAKEVILLDIQCQECGRHFKVELHWRPTNQNQSISEAISKGDLGYIHYGDPPRHRNTNGKNRCYAGDTMSADSMKILEFWSELDSGEWERLSQYEIVWED